MGFVVYNACYGGFSLSPEAIVRGRELSGNPQWGGMMLKGEIYPGTDHVCTHDYGHPDHTLDRHDPVLVQVVRELGDKASGFCSKLAITEIAKGKQYLIDEYDGYESVNSPSDYSYVTMPD